MVIVYKAHVLLVDTLNLGLSDSTLKSIKLCAYSSTGLLPEFDSVDKTNPNCVVIGDAAEKFSYQNLNEAFRVLMEKPVLFSLGQG